MKISELPSSLYHSLKLSLKPVSSFKEDTKERIPVIVSLTTIPSRIGTLHLTIRSILNQNVLPKKVVLWLNDSYEGKIPKKLKKLIGDTFEVRYSPYTFSHRKLIHSIDTFPNDIIITCDDDLIYEPTSISQLYKEHLENPNAVIGNRCRCITYDDNGEVLPYLNWPFYKKGKTHNKNLYSPVGAFLVLYPPNALYKQYNDIDLINKLAPKSDDLWFKAMALLNGTMSMPSKIEKPEPIPIAFTQKVSLKKINNTQDYNRTQWEQLCDYFKLKF
ncbi:MAG: glycosyl transferase [Winogradskyella sp.]